MSNDSPRQVRRREKLRALLGNSPGAQAELAAEISTPKSHISAVLAGRRGVGDALAAKLEKHYGKPAGWLDEPMGAWPFSPELQEKVAALGSTDRSLMEVAMWAHLREDVPESVAARGKTLRDHGSQVNGVATVEKRSRSS